MPPVHGGRKQILSTVEMSRNADLEGKLLTSNRPHINEELALRTIKDKL